MEGLRESRVDTGGRARAVTIFEDLHVLAALSGGAVLLAAWSQPLWGTAFQVLCPLRELTGIPCPTCFGTRALVAAVSGDVFRALRFNPLVAIGGFALIAYVPFTLVATATGLPRLQVSETRLPLLAPVAVALVLVNWVYLLVAHV